jgi:hypothetical protein
MKIPDYSTTRKNVGFTWYANTSYYVLLDISGITLKDFNINPDAGIELFKEDHRRAVKEIYGTEVEVPAITTPKISYGHINGLGVELLFPDKGEVNYIREKKSLDAWIKTLKTKKDIDFSKQGMAKFYIDYKRELEKAYPGERVGFGYGYEGPITTAYELRDMNVFVDPYDEHDKFKEFLEILTDSIVNFTKFALGVNNQRCFKKDGITLYDDVASMFSPSLWDDFVLPYWNKFFYYLTDGVRKLHCEDLSERHMCFIEKALISSYDPGISHKLNPKIIYENTRVPFGWRMGGFHIKDLNCSEIQDWVYKTTADGASYIFITISNGMTDSITVEKIKTFIKSCKNVEKMLNEGSGRDSIRRLVSPEGLEKFWKHWPH